MGTWNLNLKHYLIYVNSCIGFLFVATILAPFRYLFEHFWIREPDYFRGANSPTIHKKKVQEIQEQIRAWNKGGRNGRLCSSRASWKQFLFRNLDKSKMNQIKVELEDIVEIDRKNMILTVEPRMKMGTITHKLLPQGLTIPLVPELEELTIGGLICGAGVETSSHKHGLFFESCLSYEVVLPDGSCVNCSETENPDLFHSIPMSYGTVGFITAVKIPLLHAKKYVKLQYHSATSSKGAVTLLSDSNHDFVEGLQFGKNKFVIIYGDLTDQLPSSHKPKTFTKWHDQFYHWDTETYFGKPNGQYEQYVPLRDYYHRHRKAYFWCWVSAAPYFKYAIVRWTIGWVLPLNVSFTKMISSVFMENKLSNMVEFFETKVQVFVQDYIIPIDKLPEMLEMITTDLELYPIWLCPSRFFPSEGMIQPIDNKETLYIDVGVYGVSHKSLNNIKGFWKKYEKFTSDNKGIIWFYTDSYLSQEEFNEMFPNKLYTEVRRKYGCEAAFPTVYDKVSMAVKL